MNYNKDSFNKIVLFIKYLNTKETCNMIEKIDQLMSNELNNSRRQCLARIHTGQRCSRKIRSSSCVEKFCGSHIHSRPYGRTDETPENSCQLFEKKTRGRKAKNKINTDLNAIDLSEYLKTKYVTIDNTEYLTDGNIILTTDTNTIIGINTNDDSVQWLNKMI